MSCSRLASSIATPNAVPLCLRDVLEMRGAADAGKPQASMLHRTVAAFNELALTRHCVTWPQHKTKKMLHDERQYSPTSLGQA
jgi:hypothetical protein